MPSARRLHPHERNRAADEVVGIGQQNRVLYRSEVRERLVVRVLGTGTVLTVRSAIVRSRRLKKGKRSAFEHVGCVGATHTSSSDPLKDPIPDRAKTFGSAIETAVSCSVQTISSISYPHRWDLLRDVYI